MIVTYQNIWVNNGGLVASFEKVTPYLVFEFTNGSYVPTVGTGNNYTARFGTWTRVSASPNRWKWESVAEIPFNNWLPGWGCAFSSQDSTPAARLTTTALDGTCSIIEAGGNFLDIQETDRMFAGCDAITSFCSIPLKDGVITNTAGMFSGCTGVTDASAFSYYLRLNEYGSISNHSGMFSDCGPSTYLAEIPTSWGGTQVAASDALTLAVDSPKYSWTVTADTGSLDFSTLASVDIWTNSSMSQYAGINMRRGNTKWIWRNTTSNNVTVYYYPCLMQCYTLDTSYPDWPEWIMLTTNYNGMLASGTIQGDMPGTLDKNSIGPLTYKWGSFVTNLDVHFAFYVTDSSPTDIANDIPFRDRCGFQNNSYYQASSLEYDPNSIITRN